MNRVAANGHSGPSEGQPAVSPISGFSQATTSMDIARPDLARKKRRRQILWGVVTLTGLALVTVVLARLEPASPTVENPWVDTVKRGQMLRQVRGNGVLVPEQIQFVQADTGGVVERIFIQPGAEVTADTVILQLGNPDLKQLAFDSEWAARAAEAQLDKLKVTLESDRLAQESLLASLRSDARQAELDARADEELAKSGLVPLITQQKSRSKADDLAARVLIDEKRLKFAADSAKSQLAVQEAEVAKLRAARDLKQQQVAALMVKAGIAGVLTQLGDLTTLQSGQRVAPSATLAKVVVPSKLKAEIKVIETQARDVTLGQKVEIDTRNGVVPGHVIRVDPAVVAGTVLIEVKLDGALPKGARPDLSVEGTIELERLDNAIYVGRPVQAQPDSTVGLFRLAPDGKHANRVPVKLGRASVSTIEVVEGLQPGDKVIISDVSQWDAHNKVKLN
jgi:HlyD family secretion protein